MEGGRLIEALKLIRGLYPTEAALLAALPAGEAAPPPSVTATPSLTQPA